MLTAFAVSSVLALYVAYDANRRRDRAPIHWTAATILGSFFVLPFYLAHRRLMPGEVRVGGKAWNVARYFALGWTVLVLGGFAAGCAGLALTEDYVLDGGQAVRGLAGTTFFALLWLGGVTAALLVGFMLRNPAEVERG